jgi:uncharacterized protein
MTQQQIEVLSNEGIFPDGNCEELIETHASWVILTQKFAFKIKKPVKFSFLDFSTLALRKHACEEEVRLNRRLTDIYLEAVPVFFDGKKYGIGTAGETVEFAVQMQRVDHGRQMDLLLKKGLVKDSDIEAIAEQLAVFHQNARVVKQPFDEAAAKADFADLSSVSKVLTENVDENFETWIIDWIELAAAVLKKLAWRFGERVEENFVRDGHGDLHARNIFLLEKPVIFDCIEFNEHFRVNDVLSELAFLAMDLKRFGRKDFKGILIKKYSETFPCFQKPEDYVIFQYFLLYRATVRLKVAGLQLKEELTEPDGDAGPLKSEIRSLGELCRNYAGKLEGMAKI